MRPVRIALLIATLGAMPAWAGLLDDDEARRQIADQRAKTEARFDQQARAQLELSGQIQRLVDDNARLRGQIETLTYELEVARKRQQDFYLDLDTRVRKLETPPVVEADPAKPAVDPAREGQEYEAALNLFKTGKYKDAAGAFTAFVQKYPDSQLAPNAQYWLGNAWYAQRDCKRAIEAQNVVIEHYANSPKAADAWLALATCQQEMGNALAARRSLDSVIAGYPDSQAAGVARERLKKK